MLIRKAHIKDVPKMHKVINAYAKKNVMLPRALSEIYENIQTFYVAEQGRDIVGCAALQISWEDLAEVKAVAVDPGYVRKGVGDSLVRACFREAKALGVKRVFCLTFVPDYFKRFGFKKVSRNVLPHKIWGECVRCPLFPNCDEVPMMKTI